jgi:hypothetical protein
MGKVNQFAYRCVIRMHKTISRDRTVSRPNESVAALAIPMHCVGLNGYGQQ